MEKKKMEMKWRCNMKKVGLIAGVSFLAGALFFALSFGFLQKSETNEPVLTQPEVQAEAIKITGLNFAPLVKRVKPAVVKVMSESLRERSYGDSLLERFFEMPRRRRRERVPGVGSGFFISSDGYIITNNHVVKNALKVTVKTIDEREYKAKVIGTDPKTDLALLKIKAKNLPFIELGDSNKAEVGEWVLAIGNPLDQELTVTAGIVSAKGRQLGLATYEDFLQTDAAINVGNSGGPLINMEGKVIGINSAILAPSGGNVGIGFAIPSSMAKKVINDLKEEGRVVRGYLGITIQTLTQQEAEELDYPSGGVLIGKVEKGSPAEDAGLKKWDLIVKVNGNRVKTGEELSTRIAELSPGDKVELEIFGSKKSAKKTVTATVGEAPETEVFRPRENEEKTFDLGMVLVDNSPALAREYNLKTPRGILVKQVERGGVAERNEIQRLDVILEANRYEVDTVEDFREIISRKRPGSMILLYVNRNGTEGFVRFRLPE
jgi:serine protease Do